MFILTLRSVFLSSWVRRKHVCILWDSPPWPASSLLMPNVQILSTRQCSNSQFIPSLSVLLSCLIALYFHFLFLFLFLQFVVYCYSFFIPSLFFLIYSLLSPISHSLFILFPLFRLLNVYVYYSPTRVYFDTLSCLYCLFIYFCISVCVSAMSLYASPFRRVCKLREVRLSISDTTIAPISNNFFCNRRNWTRRSEITLNYPQSYILSWECAVAGNLFL